MSSRRDIWQTALAECEAMVDHAFASGLAIPDSLMMLLQNTANPKLETNNSIDPSSEVIAQDKPQPNAQKLTLLHNKLSAIVAPASPRTLLLMREQRDKNDFILMFGRLPFIRYLMAVAILAMVSLITISMSPEINNDTISLSLLENSGTSLLRVQALFLAAAALGASFSALFQANKYIVNGTFDPKYEASYCIRFVVGLIAGIIMTQVIPTTGLEQVIAKSAVVTAQTEKTVDFIEMTLDQKTSIAADANTANKVTPANSTPSKTGTSDKQQSASLRDSQNIAGMIKITLALLGGFSASLVYLILNRIVETIKFFIEPALSSKQAVLETSQKNNFEAQNLQTRTELINSVISLQQRLTTIDNKDPTEANKLLNNFINQILNPDSSMSLPNIDITNTNAENNINSEPINTSKQ